MLICATLYKRLRKRISFTKLGVYLVLKASYFKCLILSFLMLALFASSTHASDYRLAGRVPKITIAGQEVLTNDEIRTHVFDRDMPTSLKTNMVRLALENRRAIQVWEHDPKRGPDGAPVVILEITDLSCVYCQAQSKMVDDVFKTDRFKNKIQHIVMHLPLDAYNMTNSAAFYGRLAHDADVFWPYRESLYDSSDSTDNIYVEKLMNSGVDIKTLRQMSRENARRYFRELDADIKAVKKLSEMRPPAIYVNGIKLGGGVPYDQIYDLIDYEIKLFERQQ